MNQYAPVGVLHVAVGDEYVAPLNVQWLIGPASDGASIVAASPGCVGELLQATNTTIATVRMHQCGAAASGGLASIGGAASTTTASAGGGAPEPEPEPDVSAL